MAAVFLALSIITSRTAWLSPVGVLVIIGFVLPTRARHERRAEARARQLAAAELERRSERFRAALTEPDASVAGVLALQKELGLTDEEIGSSTAAALQAGLAHEQFAAHVAAEGLPRLAGHERFVGDSHCAFAETVVYDKRGPNDPTGTLFLTGNEAVFYAESAGGRVAAPWSKVVAVAREGLTLSVQRRDRQTPLLFDCASLGDALRAELIARHLLEGRAAQSERDTPRRDAARSAPAECDAVTDTDEAPVGTTIELPGIGHFTMSIVGESYRQSTLRDLAGDRRKRDEEVIFVAALVPEPTNPYDANAVKVYVHGGGQVGYLSRDDAAAFRAVTDLLSAQHAAGLCRAKLVGGTDDKPSIGVVLDLADVKGIANRLAGDQQPF